MKRFLVVDDDPTVGRVLQRYLESKRVEVVVANTGIRALEVAKTVLFDLILLDIMMPQVGGLEVLKELKAAGIKSPVIMITAIDDFSLVKEALSLGAKDFIRKPIDLDYLDGSETWLSWFK